MTNLIKSGFILLFSCIFLNITTINANALEISQNDFPIQERSQLQFEQQQQNNTNIEYSFQSNARTNDLRDQLNGTAAVILIETYDTSYRVGYQFGQWLRHILIKQN